MYLQALYTNIYIVYIQIGYRTRDCGSFEILDGVYHFAMTLRKHQRVFGWHYMGFFVFGAYFAIIQMLEDIIKCFDGSLLYRDFDSIGK